MTPPGIRTLVITATGLLLTACAAVLLVAGGSLSNSIASVAVFTFPNEVLSRLETLVPVGPGPMAMALEPNGERLFILENAAVSVAMLDTRTYEVTGRIPLTDEPVESRSLDDRYEPFPVALAFAPDGHELYLTTNPDQERFGGAALVFADPAEGTVTARVDTRGSPLVLAVTPDGCKLYVTHREGAVAVVDIETRRVVKLIHVDSRAQAIVASKDGRWILVANTSSPESDVPFGAPVTPGSTVTLINAKTDQIAATIPVGIEPTMIATRGSKAYVLNRVSGTVSVLNLESSLRDDFEWVKTALPVGDNPLGMALVEARDRLYVSSNEERVITVIDTGSDRVTDRIRLAGRPSSLAATEDGGRLFALLPGENKVAALDPREPGDLVEVSVGEGPVAVAIQDDARQGFALALESNDITVFDTGSGEVKAIAALELQPFDIVLDDSSGRAFVTNGAHNTVTAVDLGGARTPVPIRVGTQPFAVALDANGSLIYVLNGGDETLSKVDVVTARVIATFSDLGMATPPDDPDGFPGSDDLFVTTSLSDVEVAPDGGVVYVLHDRLVALDANHGSLLNAWDLPFFQSTSALTWSPDGRFLFVLGTFSVTGQSYDGLIVSRLDTASSQLSDFFVIEDPTMESVSIVSISQNRVILEDASDYRRLIDVNVINLGGITIFQSQVFDTDAGDFLALSPLGDRVYVSHAGIGNPGTPPGAVVGVDLATGSVTFRTEFDGRVSALAVSNDGTRLYATLTAQDRLAVLDAATGAILSLIHVPRVQRFPATG